MNFLSFTMLSTSYSTHISVKALLKLFLTESQGQRDGWNFTNPKDNTKAGENRGLQTETV